MFSKWFDHKWFDHKWYHFNGGFPEIHGLIYEIQKSRVLNPYNRADVSI